MFQELAARCTRRPSPPPSRGWPLLKPRSSALSSSSCCFWLWRRVSPHSGLCNKVSPTHRWGLMTEETPRSLSTPGAPRSPPTLWASSSPSLQRRSRGKSESQVKAGQVHNNHIPPSISLSTKLIICMTRAWYYCKACHEDMKNETQIRKCKCKNCEYIEKEFSKNTYSTVHKSTLVNNLPFKYSTQHIT